MTSPYRFLCRACRQEKPRHAMLRHDVTRCRLCDWAATYAPAPRLLALLNPGLTPDRPKENRDAQGH